MAFRERNWCRRLKVNRNKKLPKVHPRFLQSQFWADQIDCIDRDLPRMPHMHRENVCRIVRRHAASTPWHPYTQGHLYLIYVAALVMRHEGTLFWTYNRLCHRVFKFGPDTSYSTKVIPSCVYDSVQHQIDVCPVLFEVVIRMRWLFIMFGQTFTTPESVCVAWDYLLIDQKNMFKLAIALLQRSWSDTEILDVGCGLERLQNMVAISVPCAIEAAELVAFAQDYAI